MVSRNDITGIILCGGKSSRMGTDKGFLKLQGKTFTEYCIDALEPCVSQTIIVSDNENYDVFNIKRIEDKVKNSGPLAGVYSGLSYSKTRYNIVLSCDTPLINNEIIKLLKEGIDGNSEVIQLKNKDKLMPLIAVYDTACSKKFETALSSGEKRLQYALNQCKTKIITLPKELENRVLNINTPNDLKLLLDMDFSPKTDF